VSTPTSFNASASFSVLKLVLCRCIETYRSAYDIQNIINIYIYSAFVGLDNKLYKMHGTYIKTLKLSHNYFTNSVHTTSDILTSEGFLFVAVITKVKWLSSYSSLIQPHIFWP